MDQNEKKPKKRSRGWVVLLLILLILAGTLGFLYYSVVKAPLELDDPLKMAAAAPMSAEERFQFTAADGTVRIKLDATDLWSLVIAHAGPDFLDTINRELSGYSLTVSGGAIRMDEEGLRLDLELFYQDIRLVAKVPCAVKASGRTISLQPTGVKLGIIPLPVDSLLSSVKLEYELDIPVISDVTQVSFGQDTLLISGSMEEDIRSLVPLSNELGYTGVFFEDYQPLADALRVQDGYAAILSWLEQNPGSVEALYQDLFVLAGPEKTAEYRNKRYVLMERFLSGIDFSGIAEKQAFLAEQLPSLAENLENIMKSLERDFNSFKFNLIDGEFLCNGMTFQAAQYSDGRYDELFDYLDPDSFFLILVDAENGFTRQTLPLSYKAELDLEFTQNVDYDKIYIVGCVFRRTSGAPVLMYRAEEKQDDDYFRFVDLVPLTEKEVTELQVPGKFGVWSD